MKEKSSKHILKILVAGHFASGKTTFVKTLTKKILDTEKKIFHKTEREVKETTTVAMDFAEYETDGYRLHIFGIPGQERFSFMWPILAKNAGGIIYLLDSADSTYWYQIFKQINMFRKIGLNVPFIFAANKQDLPNAMSIDEIRKKMKLPNWVKIIPTVAFNEKSVRKVIESLIEEINKYKTLENQVKAV